MRVLALLLLTCLTLPTEASTQVNIALGAEINTFDPHMTASVGSDLSIASHLYSSLILRGPDLQLQPSLALQWEAVDDTHWRFELDPRAHFANGEPLDAAAVVWNLERVSNPAIHARIAPWFSGIEHTQAIDATTVLITTKTTVASLPSLLSMLFLLPPKWATTHDPAREVMPSGPYRINEYQPGDHLALIKNEQYWKEPPSFDQVNFRSIPDASARVAALLTGEVDWINAIPLSEIERIQKGDKAVAAVQPPSSRSVFIKLNTLRPPLDNPKVRQALNYAIDKNSIVSSLFDGQAMVSKCQLLTPAYFGYNPALPPYPFDPQKARQLLAEAGVAKGTHLQLEVPAGIYLQGDEVTQVVASQLKDVGLDIEIVQYDFATWLNKYLKKQQLGDMSLLAYGWPSLDADGLLSLLKSDSLYAYYRDKTLDTLLAQGNSTLDSVTRQATYRQATEHLCATAPVLYLYEQPYTYGISKRIQWRARSDDWIRAYDMVPNVRNPEVKTEN